VAGLRRSETSNLPLTWRVEFSTGTFERACVEPMQATDLKETLGEEYDWLPSEDRPPRARWVVRRIATPQPPTGIG